MNLHPDSTIGAITHDRSEISFHDTGSPGDGKTPIVLVHGTGGNTETHFRTLFPMLAARHRVIGVDLTVHDGSTVDDLVAQVLAVVTARAAGTPVHLVGYSLGAVVAAALAGRQPEPVETLTLIAGWITTDQQQRLRNSVWRALADRGGRPLQEFQTLLAHSPQFLRSRSSGDLESMITNRVLRAGTGTEMEINRGVDINSDVARITAPTLVIACTEDQMVPKSHSMMLLGGIQNSRLAEVSSGHAVTIERPAQLFMLIDDFVTHPEAVAPGHTIAPLTV